VPDDIIRNRFGKKLDTFGAYDRRVASSEPNTRVYRPGDEVVDTIADYIAWDDRGQSFAIWREDSSWSKDIGSEWAGFRFDLVIEADTGVASTVLHELGATPVSQQALIRQSDGLLPPRVTTVFVDVNLNEVVELSLLRILRRRFCKYRTTNGQDHNLTKHRTTILDSIVSNNEWEGLCRNARDAAVRFVRNRETYRAHNHQHAEDAKRAMQLKGEQLRLRIARTTDEDAAVTTYEVALEEKLGTALISGIREPKIRVDAAGFIVISGRSPMIANTPR
jgi:ATP-dependent helicase HepA